MFLPTPQISILLEQYVVFLHGRAQLLQQVFKKAMSACVQGKREAVIAVYESKPLVSDHKIPGADFTSGHHVS